MTHDPSSSLITGPPVIASAVGVRRLTYTAVEYGPRVTAGSPLEACRGRCSAARSQPEGEIAHFGAIPDAGDFQVTPTEEKTSPRSSRSPNSG